MSRFTRLSKYLSFHEAFNIYLKLKTGSLKKLHVSKLAHPFCMRNNPYDYATFEEVILKETYNIPLEFTPQFIIDGGGNIGLTAAYFATKYPEATIVSLEPDKDNFSVLEQNTFSYKNVIPIQGGIWNTSTYLLVKDIGLGCNSIIVEETNKETPAGISSFNIADIMEKMNWPHVDILKLDVEGSEKEIFSFDYEAWLPKTKVLIVELHDRIKKGSSQALFSAISQYNFSLDITGENLVFRNEESLL